MSDTHFYGEQPHIINTFTTTFWCEACMHTRVIIASNVQGNIIHIIDYMVGDDQQVKEKYVSYLVAIKKTDLESETMMNSIDEGHIKNLHPDLLLRSLNRQILA